MNKHEQVKHPKRSYYDVSITSRLAENI